MRYIYPDYDRFVCRRCRNSFDRHECRSIVDDFFDETDFFCPYCGANESYFSEPIKCKVCKEEVPEDYTVDGCCKDCLETIFEEEFDYYIEDFAKLFPEEDREDVISDYRQDNSPGKKDFRAIYDTSDIYECIAKEQ